MAFYSRDLATLQRNIDSMFGAMRQSLHEGGFAPSPLMADSLLDDFMLTPTFPSFTSALSLMPTESAGTAPSSSSSPSSTSSSNSGNSNGNGSGSGSGTTALSTAPSSSSSLAPMEAGRSFNQLAAHMHLDVHSTPTQYLVSCDLPGLDKSAIDISTDPRTRTLTIKAERKQEYVQKDPPDADQPRSIRQERFYGTVQRSIRLARDADLDRVEAKYENGVLSMNVPRKQLPEEERTKKVQLL